MNPSSTEILFFNPRALEHKPRIPNSLLQVAASIDQDHRWHLVDGNLETEPLTAIAVLLEKYPIKIFACTVMPGPQLRQAIPISKWMREHYPAVIVVWGGYFPSNHAQVVLGSGYVDFIINGMGDKAFPLLVKKILANETDYNTVPNLIFIQSHKLVKTPKDEIYNLDELPALPYEKLNSIYSLEKYLGKTYLGKKTIAYHSSFGCPFTCSFCAVVPIYNARWKGKAATLVYEDIMRLKTQHGADAIEFHDNNFFVSEKRTQEFSTLIAPHNMVWWGEGRIDTIDRYSDHTLQTMRQSGCKMIFFGAETGNDAVLKKMDKGGTQSGAQILRFAKRMLEFDIIPEYSFVLGTPAESEAASWRQIKEDIAFIRKVKDINPSAEIIIYIYSPVPTEGSTLFSQVKATGFNFPQTLEDWLTPAWENFDLRKNPLTPWLTSEMIQHIKDFETVLNARFPTISDIRLNQMQRSTLQRLGYLRYHTKIYRAPYELKLLQKIWKYRQPETEGF
ncbi:MAG: hypothetical protein RIQ89_844 [Bacteroidota bacterium]